jgi:hypothetical protein
MEANQTLSVFSGIQTGPICTLLACAALASIGAEAVAADIELSESLQLPECHSIGWVRVNTQPKDAGEWNAKLDEAKWGTPSENQPAARNWVWDLNREQWEKAVQEKGEGKREECVFDLWIPEGVAVIRGVVAISAHGSGVTLYRHPELRKIARELQLAVFKFVGNPVQRGFWPKEMLYERLGAMGTRGGHPEIQFAPLFLYGHSNGTGFSALFPATEAERVWAWVSMRPGITHQVYQPGAAHVPGLVIFGEDDPFLARPSREENLGVVKLMRRQHNAVWHYAVEPKTGHGPGEKTWPLVFSFLKHTWAARVPADADPRSAPVKLSALVPEKGFLGRNWDVSKGGYQVLPVAPFAAFGEEKASASWLINAAYAADWQSFQSKGMIE